MATAALALGAGSILGGLFGASSATKAAEAQAAAANNAASLQYLLGQQSLGFQQSVYNNTQAQAWPYMQAGYGGLANLSNLLGISPQGSYPTQPASASYSGTGGSMPAPSGTGIRSGGGSGIAYTVPGGYATPGIPGLTPSIMPSPTSMPGGMLGGLYGDLVKKTGAKPASSLGDALNQFGGAGGPQTGTAQMGGAPLSSLVNPSLGATGSLMQSYPGGPWQMPTGQQALDQDPGYQFRLQQGMAALQNSAAAKGSLFNGSTGADIQNYGQDAASQEYQNAYNRSLTNFNTNYNAWNNDQTNKYNRLAALSGIGQTTSQQLQNGAFQAAGQYGNTLSSLAGNIGQQYNNAAAATASGYVGGGNAMGQGLSGGLAALAGYLKNRNGASSGIPDQGIDFYSLGGLTRG